MITNKKFKLNKELSIDAYEKMLLVRRFEEKCTQLYGMGLIHGFCHLYIGQEAIITGVELVKKPEDSTITSYRDHGHVLISGMHPKYVLAELMGKKTGCSKGKGGSMHLFNAAGKFYGGHGIVGAQVPIGTGIALAEKYKGTDNICFTFLGDGATNQGQVFEAYNMAALWKLPVVYIIENNYYAMGTSVARHTAIADLYKKGTGCGIKGYEIDGMDLEAVYNALKQAAEFVRFGNGPIILEMKTYRYRGHSMSDPAKYRTKEEVEQKKELDPLIYIKNKILESKYLTELEVKEIENKIKSILNEAVDFCEKSTLPDDSELFNDVYVSNS